MLSVFVSVFVISYLYYIFMGSFKCNSLSLSVLLNICLELFCLHNVALLYCCVLLMNDDDDDVSEKEFTSERRPPPVKSDNLINTVRYQSHIRAFDWYKNQ